MTIFPRSRGSLASILAVTLLAVPGRAWAQAPAAAPAAAPATAAAAAPQPAAPAAAPAPATAAPGTAATPIMVPAGCTATTQASGQVLIVCPPAGTPATQPQVIAPPAAPAYVAPREERKWYGWQT